MSVSVVVQKLQSIIRVFYSNFRTTSGRTFDKISFKMWIIDHGHLGPNVWPQYFASENDGIFKVDSGLTRQKSSFKILLTWFSWTNMTVKIFVEVNISIFASFGLELNKISWLQSLKSFKSGVIHLIMIWIDWNRFLSLFKITYSWSSLTVSLVIDRRLRWLLFLFKPRKINSR